MSRLEDDEYEVPLRDQRYFGAGIKRKRVKFVPQTLPHESIQSLPTTPTTSVAERYRQVVLKKGLPVSRGTSVPLNEHTSDVEETQSEETTGVEEATRIVCDICHHPITNADSVTAHASSIAHQICLQHSHPPSHIDRRRKGLAVLTSQGWDPDSRQGLGAVGDGILHPIKAKDNPNRAGLGITPEMLKRQAVEKPPKLDAGKVRLREKEAKKKAQRLRESFYRSEDVVRYLGE